MNEKFDAVVVLGAQIGLNTSKKMILAPHTRMRVVSAGMIYNSGLTKKIILTGGHNFGIRYALDISKIIFGLPGSKRKPDFTQKARIKAKKYRSEASVMAEVLENEFNVLPGDIILEELSTTTRDHPTLVIPIAKREGLKKIGILTQLYHMDSRNVIPSFRDAATLTGVVVEPILAEDILAKDSASWRRRIIDYYSVPRGGKKYDISLIKKNINSGKSIAKNIIKF